jgi:GGDEF domain-containing protein
MEAVAGDDDVIFRIGGDEFVLLTNSEDETYAQSLANQILFHNEEPIDFEGQKNTPVSLCWNRKAWEKECSLQRDVHGASKCHFAGKAENRSK